jgi:hypothetical protein
VGGGADSGAGVNKTNVMARDIYHDIVVTALKENGKRRYFGTRFENFGC